MFQWCFYAGLVKIHRFGSGDRVKIRVIFKVFIVWWPWKLGQSHQNLIKSLNDPNVTIYEIWPESIIWLKRQDAESFFFFFGQNLKILQFLECGDLEN